ncbi:MAG: Holliday junction resolvase RuvX [bacterium]|nr:Holliday junction resolvase RuvX [bacterium]
MLTKLKNYKRILGVDLGIQRTGLALSDERHITTRALPNLIPKSRIEDVEYLLDLCQNNDVDVVIIGYPLMPRSETEGSMAKRARGFADCLEKTAKERNIKIFIYLLNEILTSKEATMRLVQSGIKKKDRSKLVDGEAARIFIEDFLAMQGEHDGKTN